MYIPSIDFLVTTVGLQEDEIISKILKLNILGNVIVGNQMCKYDSVKEINLPNLKLKIVNMTSRGTSLNRNTIFKYATSDYVTFWDDDSVMNGSSNSPLDNLSKKELQYDAIRYNYTSSNSARPIKQINKNKRIRFRELKSFGVCGIFFKRDVLIKQNLKFREYLGPGSEITHGEDTIFIKDFLKLKNSVFQKKELLFCVEQNDSCWYSQFGTDKYFYSQGFCFFLEFGIFSYLFSIVHILKHKNEYDNIHFFRSIKLMWKGINKSIRCKKTKCYKNIFEEANE